MYELILACDSEYGIGKDGKIPWNCPEDIKNFYNLTDGHVVIMGRKTYESLGKPLANRHNIIVSSSVISEVVNIICCKTFEGALKTAKMYYSHCKIFVIGGAQIAKAALEYCEPLNYHITFINKSFNCDVFLPELDNYKDSFDNRWYPSVGGFDITIVSKIGTCGTWETQYLNTLAELVDTEPDESRNGATRSLFGRTIRVDVGKEFPLLTTKKVNFEHVLAELEWFLSGSTDVSKLSESGVKVWDANTSAENLKKLGLNYEAGDMGPMYGFNYRHFGAKYRDCKWDYEGEGVDQVTECLHLLKNDPKSRRIIMTSYNPSVVRDGVLPPCHGLFTQFAVKKGKLNCVTMQRSGDWFLGVPWNLASYALLMYKFATECGLEVGELVYNFGDVHLYESHVSAAVTQLLRCTKVAPTYENGKLCGYNPHKGIIAKMIV